MRLSKEKQLEKDTEIASGYLTCKTCNNKRELYLFNRQVKNDIVYYKSKKCKICTTGREPKVQNKILIGDTTKTHRKFIIKKSIKLSPDTKKFIKRVIFMKGYIDSVEAFKLVHYHINTFGHVDRLILDIETELTIMFQELLEVYKRNKNKNNI